MRQEAKKQKIIECFKKCKLKQFNQANLDDVRKCSGMRVRTFVDLIWEMWQEDQIAYCLSGRTSPHSPMTPKRGVFRWSKTATMVAESIRDKVPNGQLLTFGYPRYLVIRQKYLEKR